MTSPTPARTSPDVAALEDRLADTSHQPRRPLWTCDGCHGDTPWPCPPARVRLAETFVGDRVGMAMYLSALLTAALTEMPRTPPTELFERFVAWTR